MTPRVNLQAQRGQGLAEFFTVALVLVPIFLLLPMIAKYQDIAHATEMASRYVAFEATIHNDQMSAWKDPDQLAGEVQRRFYSNPTAPIKTGDTAGDFKAHQNLFWRDPKGDALIRNFNSDIQISFGPTSAAGHLSGFIDASDGDPFSESPHPLDLPDAMDLKPRGIYRANVTVRLANVPADIIGPTRAYDLLKDINLSMTRHTDVLIDPWSAKSAEHIRSRLADERVYSGDFFENGAGSAIRTTINLGVGVMESPKNFPSVCGDCGPRLGKLDRWDDRVPADRLR